MYDSIPECCPRVYGRQRWDQEVIVFVVRLPGGRSWRELSHINIVGMRYIASRSLFVMKLIKKWSK
jgi:hypothetical protein